MKKIIFTILILFLTTLTLQAQIYQSKVNSSTTPLGANATYTGSAEKVMNFNNVYPYNYIVVVVKSDSSGSGKIQSSLNGTTWVTNMPFTYTAPDTITNRFITPVVLPYVRVVYTNGSKAQNSFSLTTTFINSSFSVNSISDITIGNIGSITGPVALPTGASTSANQTTQIAKEDSIVDKSTESAASLAIMDDWDETDRAKVNPIVGQAGVAANRGTASATTQRVTIANNDTLSTLNTAIKTAVELLDNSVDGNYLNTNMNVAGTDVAGNRGTANAQTLRVAVANNDTTSTLQTAIKTSVELIDNAVDGNYLNVNTNFAGVDASVNIGNANTTTQRVVLASDQPPVAISLTSGDTVVVKNITNALPAGDNNIGNVDIVSLPAGNLGQQLSAASLSVTPATNIADATYVGDIKFGESLPSGTAIVGQVGIDQTTPGTTNKVSIGTDGTVTANAGTNLNTSALSLESSQLILLGYQHPADKFPSDTVPKDTVTTETDSLTISTYFSSAPTVWSSMTVRNISTDGTVLQISLSSTFAGSRLVYPNGVDGFSFFSPVSFTKLYIKKYSGTNGFYETSGEAY